MKHLLTLTLTLICAINLAQAQVAAKSRNLKKDFDTLGDNQEVVERVRNLDTQQKVRIVQNRLVDRNNRVEVGMNYSYLGSGDSYVKTQNGGAMLEYHINPHWSVGAQHQKSFNSLTSEATAVYDRVQSCQAAGPGCTEKFPALDYPVQSTIATISYYPIYGKLNLFDAAVAHFDLYTSLGYGQIQLLSGTTNLTTAALGVGTWLSSRVTTRLEVRYHRYQDLLLTDKRQQSQVLAQASLGILIW
ncbi:MAG: outer membrane beta-barrel domain-containing protein [Bdellovibrionota bacterium]